MSPISNIRLLGVGLHAIVSAVSAGPVPTNSTSITAAGPSNITADGSNLPFYQAPMLYDLPLRAVPSGVPTSVNPANVFSGKGSVPGIEQTSFWDTTLYCNDGTRWVDCSYGTINTGIDYLRNHAQPCVVNGRSCSRVSCSYNAAIYLCNDNNYQLSLSCWDDGNTAAVVVGACTHNNGHGWVVSGQQFTSDNWNVIVEADHC